MNHPIYRITSVDWLPPYSLRLRFNDGLVRTIDFESILEGELFGPLRDPAVFSQAPSTRRFIQSFGSAEPISTRLRFTIGPNTKPIFVLRLSAGAMRCKGLINR